MMELLYGIIVRQATDKLQDIMGHWVVTKRRVYRYAIKDNVEFKDFMLKELRGSVVTKADSDVYIGKVLTVTTDRYGNLFGFIAHRPTNIYFNELDNPGMDISYEGKRCLFV